MRPMSECTMTSAEPAPVIALRGVAKHYGAETALAPTDLDIKEGEFFCLLGPSGGGKTTLLNLLGGFVAPDEGTIEIQGQRVENTPPHRRCVNTVFQRYALFPHMTVRDNVGFGLRMAKVPKSKAVARVDEALELVGLGQFCARFPSELSGGQQQRVAVARALVNRPAVLLLDEPLGALDLKLRKRLQVQLTQIHREVGTTFVHVTHDQEEAMAMADRIAVLNNGRIEQVGTVKEIYSHPRTRFVADFIGESNFFPLLKRSASNGHVVLRDGAKVPTSHTNETSDTLMVRPESLRLGRPGETAWGVTGRILQTAFLGSRVQVIVESPACDVPVQAALYQLNQHSSVSLERDEPVLVWWEPEDATLLSSHAEDEEHLAP